MYIHINNKTKQIVRTLTCTCTYTHKHTCMHTYTHAYISDSGIGMSVRKFRNRCRGCPRKEKESDLEWQSVSGKLCLCTMFASLGQTVPKQLGQCQKMGLSPNVRCKVENQTDSVKVR